MGLADRAYNHKGGAGGIPPVQFAFPPMTPLSLGLIVACVAIFMAQSFTGGGSRGIGPIENYLALNFAGQLGWLQPWRFITYQYLHGGVVHLLFNMLAVYFFVPAMELRWGWRRALGFYTLGGIVAGLVFWLIALVWNTSAVLVGASGSILAIMGAVALFYPERQIVLVFFLVPIRAAVALLGILFLLTAVAEGDLSNAAHLGGLAFGVFAPWLAGPYLARKMKQLRDRAAEREQQAILEEQREVDRILAKVGEQGMHSLTARERKTLKRATENQRRRDAAREKKIRASW